MDSELAHAILSEARARQPALERLVDPSFPPQSKFVLDDAPLILAQCTRRAGKSHGLALRLYRAGFKYAGSTPLYIALTRDSAKKIMWPVMNEINRRYELGAVLTESALTATLPNGSQIGLVGADMKNFIERLRGPKYPEVAIDEAGSFRAHLQSLIEDILEPATLDYNGSIVLAGTPGVVPQGAFHGACQASSGYSRHAWSLYQNPYLPNAAEFVARIKKKRGWTDQNPTYRREYLGEWVVDLDALVYKFKEAANCYDALPTGHDYLRVMAIDYGWHDATAFAILAYSHSLKEVFVEHVEGHVEMVPSAIAARVDVLREKYSPFRIVADTGGLGKSITEEMIKRHSIPIQPADKREKLTNIHLLNGDFIDRKLFVQRALTPLMDQYGTLTKGDDGMEDPGLPNDLCDAVLYAYRETKHYLGEVRKPKETRDAAYYARQAEAMLEQDLEEFERQKQAEREGY